MYANLIAYPKFVYSLGRIFYIACKIQTRTEMFWTSFGGTLDPPQPSLYNSIHTVRV